MNKDIIRICLESIEHEFKTHIAPHVPATHAPYVQNIERCLSAVKSRTESLLEQARPEEEVPEAQGQPKKRYYWEVVSSNKNDIESIHALVVNKCNNHTGVQLLTEETLQMSNHPDYFGDHFISRGLIEANYFIAYGLSKKILPVVLNESVPNGKLQKQEVNEIKLAVEFY